jgi:hypothetical protein
VLTSNSYTTVLTTCYETTEVYTTTTEIESFYTTVSAGSTVVLCTHPFCFSKFLYTNFVPDVTETSTIELTSAYTITETLEPPTTKATVFVSLFLYRIIIFPRRLPWLLRLCDLEDESTSNIQLLYTFLEWQC